MQATIYIRQENEEVWNRLENKSEFINQWLSQYGSPLEGVVHDPVVEKVEPELNVKSYEFCKHNAVVGMCKSGC